MPAFPCSHISPSLHTPTGPLPTSPSLTPFAGKALKLPRPTRGLLRSRSTLVHNSRFRRLGVVLGGSGLCAVARRSECSMVLRCRVLPFLVRGGISFCSVLFCSVLFRLVSSRFVSSHFILTPLFLSSFPNLACSKLKNESTRASVCNVYAGVAADLGELLSPLTSGKLTANAIDALDLVSAELSSAGCGFCWGDKSARPTGLALLSKLRLNGFGARIRSTVERVMRDGSLVCIVVYSSSGKECSYLVQLTRTPHPGRLCEASVGL